MIYVYQHIRRDKLEVFYVGIGNKRRPYSKSIRSKHWHNVVSKAGYDVEILRTCNTFEEAGLWEKFFIKMYGRKDLNLGPLVNMTEGGYGGYQPSEDRRKEMSKKWSGEGNPWYGKNRSGVNNPNFGRKMPCPPERRLALTGPNNPNYGKKRPEISVKLSGQNNPMYGKKRDDKLKSAVSKAQSKPVINIITGEIYKNTIEASEKNNINISTLRAKLINRLKNDTNLKYL